VLEGPGLGPDVRSARTTAGRQHSLLFWSRINHGRSRLDMGTRLGLARLPRLSVARAGSSNNGPLSLLGL